MSFIWQELLFRPLLNLLIGLYNTVGLQNLGLAIVWLTVLVRIFLLPLSLKDERRKRKESDLEEELAALQKSYAGDPQTMREEQRMVLKKYRFRKWPKLITLGFQGLILVILYQVFVGGIYLNKIVDALYSFVDVPISINVMFLGFDISKKSFILSLIAGLVLMVMIIAEQKSLQKKWHSSDLMYLLGYPASTVLILWLLPAVKAVFIISSLLFTAVLRLQSGFRETIKEQDAKIKMAKDARKETEKKGIPHPRERFK